MCAAKSADPCISRSDWISSQEYKGIFFRSYTNCRKFHIVKECASKLKCYALIYNEKDRLEQSDDWTRTSGLFDELLTASEGTNNLFFLMYETDDDNLKPAISLYEGGKQITRNFSLSDFPNDQKTVNSFADEDLIVKNQPKCSTLTVAKYYTNFQNNLTQPNLNNLAETVPYLGEEDTGNYNVVSSHDSYGSVEDNTYSENHKTLSSKISGIKELVKDISHPKQEDEQPDSHVWRIFKDEERPKAVTSPRCRKGIPRDEVSSESLPPSAASELKKNSADHNGYKLALTTYGEEDENKYWISYFEKYGAQHLGSFNSCDISKDGVYLIFESSDIPRPEEEKLLGLNLFYQCLKNRDMYDLKTNYFTAEIDEKQPATDTSVFVRQYCKNVCISKNLQSEAVANVNLASCCDYFQQYGAPPSKKAPLKVHCPCRSTAEALNWNCPACQSEISFGFDGFLYCSCGRSLYSNYWFKCKIKDHGHTYLNYQDDTTLLTQLESLKPFKSLNILLLGETGVGKSTLINAFANYANFNTMEKAIRSKLQVLIPTAFIVTNSDYQEQEVRIGKSENESVEEGHSSTRACKMHGLYYNGHHLNLIDTPGIGDTKGSKNDQINLNQMIHFISNFDTIDGICILMKPNQSRLSIFLRYCLEGLLSYLHMSASLNISFIFTYARGTFYRPGDSMKPLRDLLREINYKHPFIEIPLSQNNIFCFDNEGFRFLAALQQEVKFPEEYVQNYFESWGKSVDELDRLLKHVSELKPHLVKETINISAVSKVLFDLADPLCMVTKKTSKKIVVLIKQKKKIKEAKNNEEKLYNALQYTRKDCYFQESLPRVICIRCPCQNLSRYQRVCHEPCYCSTKEDTLRCSVLGKGYCSVCGCCRNYHVFIPYDSKTITKRVQVVDQNKRNELKRQVNRIAAVEEVCLKMKSDLQKLRNEKNIIIEACAIFYIFLNQNAMIYSQDPVYLKLSSMIKSEASSIFTRSKNLIFELEESLKLYNTTKSSNRAQITLEKIAETAKSLKSLEISGQSMPILLLDVLEKFHKPVGQATMV